MNTTQQHLSIKDIQDDILLLKDGGGALILQVGAVNFGLLSDREQVAIITSFAQMLNSLSFSLQIVIRSKRLNISSYLQILDRAQKAQANPLLSQMITNYRQFIQSTIKENEVLDKMFYIVIPLFSIELGLTTSKQNLEQKIKTVLLPRRDQVIRQLNRVGLQATQLSKRELIELFYDIYNGEVLEQKTSQTISPADLSVQLKQPLPSTVYGLPSTATPNIPAEVGSRKSESISMQPTTTQSSKTHPFVVEELE